MVSKFLTSRISRSMCHPAGGVPCEAINAATGFAAAEGLSVAGATFLARRSAGQSAAASSCADAVAREADEKVLSPLGL